jgi:hypothetical protein
MAIKRNQRNDKIEHHKGSLEGRKTRNGIANRICETNRTHIPEYNRNDDEIKFN